MRAASETAAAADFSPSAEMMAARRSRSASACLAIARFMSAGSSMFWSLTFSMSMPHLSVWASTISRIWAEISSRLLRISSRSKLPVTSRRAVWAKVLVA